MRTGNSKFARTAAERTFNSLLRNFIELCRNTVVVGDLLNPHGLFRAPSKQFLERLPSPGPTVGEYLLVVVLESFGDRLDGVDEEIRHYEEAFQLEAEGDKPNSFALVFGRRTTVAINHKGTGPMEMADEIGDVTLVFNDNFPCCRQRV